jgi:ADP-ribose pyrophosphatase YjhB (NUDIX family)
MSFPRAAVSVAVRCSLESSPYYLLVQRGKEPNAGRYSFPGGKLEWGETAWEGAQRELAEETQFIGQQSLVWHPGPVATADSIVRDDVGAPLFHFLIAICFAELPLEGGTLPHVTALDDAAAARWCSLEEIQGMGAESTTPGLLSHVERVEFLYQKDALLF